MEKASGPGCLLPAKITIEANGNGAIIIALQKHYPPEGLKKGLFHLDVPASYERIVVK